MAPRLRPIEGFDTVMSTDSDWERWGQRNPYFGVLTHPKFRRENLTPSTLAEFMATGGSHVDYVLGICRQRIDPTFAPSRILDFGCGVGRVLIPFAARVSEAVGMDIAPSMLAEAQRNADEAGAGNVRLVLSDDRLSTIDGSFDLVHSCIVLQHIEPVRGTALFKLLVERVRLGGIGALHVTFGWTFHAETYGQEPPPPPPPTLGPVGRVRAHLAGLKPTPPAAPPEPIADADPMMAMYYYNLSELMFILQQTGVDRVHTELTDHGGALGAYLFFRRQRPSSSDGSLENIESAKL
jgi:SAM-dependent methyltransferase